jgi:hypothetical protein
VSVKTHRRLHRLLTTTTKAPAVSVKTHRHLHRLLTTTTTKIQGKIT